MFLFKKIFSEYIFESFPFNIPARIKQEKGGEDSWLGSSKVIAVADGVS